MKKIINYIAGGQGLGIKFIALLALLLSFVFGATVKVMGSDAVPYAQQIADQMLPIKVVNGQIVEPADTYKVVHLRFNEDSDPYPIPLVLDTTSDVLDINMLDPGIYVTRSNIYFAKEHEVRTYKLANDNFELPRSDYTGFFWSVLNWTAVFVFVFAFAAMFLLYFVLCLFYSVCAVPLAAILGKKTDFDSRMRLSTVAFIAVYAVFWALRLITGLNVNIWLFFIVVIAAQAFLLSKMPVLSSTAGILPSHPAPESAFPEINPQEKTENALPAKTEKAKVKKAPAKKKAAVKASRPKAPAKEKLAAVKKAKPAAKKEKK